MTPPDLERNKADHTAVAVARRPRWMRLITASPATQQKAKRGACGLPFSLFRRCILYLLMLLRPVLRDAMMMVLDFGVSAVVPVMRRSPVHCLWYRGSGRNFGNRNG